MKKVYLTMAILGFIAPSILVFIESIETGNILLYLSPMSTIEGMFANRISSIFMIDLLFAVMVFFIWSYAEKKKTWHQEHWLRLAYDHVVWFGWRIPSFPILKRKSH